MDHPRVLTHSLVETINARYQLGACGALQFITFGSLLLCGVWVEKELTREVRACSVVDVAAVVHDLSSSGIDLLK